MSLIFNLIDFILHIDTHLIELISQYGVATYGIIFGIIFVETGLVIMPFLPGDSLLFAAGALSAQDTTGLNVHLLFLWSAIAAILGDSLNYEIGKYLWPKASEGKYKLIKKEYIIKTVDFFDRHGGKAIIFARFVPLIRTFAPFVAWIWQMSYKHFLAYNSIGWVLRTWLFIYAGYFFWNITFVQQNFSKIIILIIIVSLIPAIIAWIQHYRTRKKS